MRQLPLLHIVHQVTDARHQALAFCLDRLFQRDRIGQR